jgi:DNA-directed RNA polymerase I subunit RPA1
MLTKILTANLSLKDALLN